ncbi:hypothetical protein [Ochrobactrum sp. Marseille-Q0166]|uniref:hypothetical protein n=1 Tax=Ochrobactrum sp. Marseille-Q0166 TaxID=2761105 RepID=UPI001656023F|nr:hypothetical protein [Ochrobactrum sp. Marseille-Q0166]MBC8718809.1 hypothetical protein [Ochrobactrum sp. Marseille-Q0166]
MNRRTFFRAAALVVSSPVAAAIPVVSEIEALIKQHEFAWSRDDAAWRVVDTLDDHPELRKLSTPEVQIGRQRGKKKDDGEYELLPLYVHSDLAIDEYIDRNLETQLMFISKPLVKESLLSKTEAYRAEKKAELAQQESIRRSVEDKIGRNKACRYAEKCSAETKEIEMKILNFKPSSLRDAALQSLFVIDALETGHSYIEQDQMIDVLRSIASSITSQQIAA